MGLIVSVAPTSEPIGSQDAKDHCRIDEADDDALIRSYIITARSYIEKATDRTYPLTTYQLTLEAFADEIKLPNPPLVSVTSVQYVDEDGDTQTLSTNVYYVDTTTTPGRIVLKPNQSWPTLGDAVYPLTVTYIAGYSTANMPEMAKAAIRLLVAHFYRNRDAVSDSAKSPVPMAVDSLLSMLNWGAYP